MRHTGSIFLNQAITAFKKMRSRSTKELSIPLQNKKSKESSLLKQMSALFCINKRERERERRKMLREGQGMFC